MLEENKTVELNDDELEKVSGGFVLTKEQYESGNYDLRGNSVIEYEGDTYELVTGYTGKMYFYLYQQVGGTKQLLIPLGKL